MWRPLIEPDLLDVARDATVDRMIRDAEDRDYMSRQCTPEAYRAIKSKIRRKIVRTARQSKIERL